MVWVRPWRGRNSHTRLDSCIPRVYAAPSLHFSLVPFALSYRPMHASTFCFVLSTHACKYPRVSLTEWSTGTSIVPRFHPSVSDTPEHLALEYVTGNGEPACNSQHTSAYRSTGSVAASACLSRRFCTEFRRLVFYFYPNFSYMFVVFNLDSLFLDFSYYQFFLCELFGLTWTVRLP